MGKGQAEERLEKLRSDEGCPPELDRRPRFFYSPSYETINE
jgi:hypothetical protein